MPTTLKRETETVPINTDEIEHILNSNHKRDALHVRDVLAKGKEMKGLVADEVATLMNIDDPDLLAELFATAKYVKNEIYGSRLVLFAPLYVSNLCDNECLYCAFRVRNKAIKRRTLTQEEVAQETRLIIEQGHKRILLVAGESYPQEGLGYIIKAIETIYATKSGPGEIRRVNVNIAPLTLEEFKQLKAAHIGTYQLFQETYHREVYAKVHLSGAKRDFDHRITAIDRAVEAGIDDVGIGVLFGLADWRFEIMAMMQHIAHLERGFGVGPHTISVPRLEPAIGAPLAEHPPQPVCDMDFLKIVAILRIAVPYTGIIMSTRESAAIRRETFAPGVSQISAGSRTNPGGYADGQGDAMAQFCLGDHRSVDEVVRDVTELGYIPSFCTACYRLGRTGADFMDLAKPGDIKYHCEPNALSTFKEYLCDYATPQTREVGEQRVLNVLNNMDEKQRQIATKLTGQVGEGKRDVFV